MSKRVTIYRMAYPAAEPQGAVSVVAVGDGLEYHGEWMQHGYVTVTVNSATEIAFAVGDFVEFAGRKFYLWDEESVKKQARSGSYGEAYVYDNIKLHEGTVALEQVSMHDVVLEDNGQTYSSLSRFSFFGATVDDLADRIQANLVRQSTAIGGDTLRFRLFTPDKTRTTGRMSNMGNVGTAWESYYTGNEATGKKDVAVSIQNETLWGALGHAYNDFELPYYVASSNENDVDYIDIVIGGKAVEVSNSAFVYGKGHGLYEIERSADSDQRIVTKLFAYGSTENLPTNYYGNLYKVAYADCLQSDTLVIDGGNYYFVDAVTGSGILWSSVKDALGVRADVRPSPFSIGGHTPVGKSVTVRCNNTNYIASIWVYETGGEQYLSFKTETQAPVVSDTKFYILDGVDLLKWPNSKIETASGYPGGMAIMNLMLPGFPKQSLKEMVEYEKSHPSGNRPAWMDRAYNFTTGQYNYVLSNDPADPWIQSANAAVHGIREGEVYFDGTDDRENIRPSIDNTDFGTVASVTGITDDGWVDKTDGFVIKVLAANGGGDFWQAVWKAPHDDEVPLTMTSGYHNGREFKLTKVVVGTTYVELSVGRIQDESGRWVPNTEQPIVGRDLPTPQHDTFVVTGIQLPKEYIDAASEKLLMAAFDELDKIDHGLRTYQPRLDEIYMANEQATAEIESRASLHDTLRAGMVLKWQWEDYGTQGATVISSTIDVLTIKEDGNNGVPTYDVVLRDEKEKSLTEKIATVVSKTTGIGGFGGATHALSADRLSDNIPRTAWGQSFWQEGKPQNINGSLSDVDDIDMSGKINIGVEDNYDGFAIEAVGTISQPGDKKKLKFYGDVFSVGAVSALGMSAEGNSLSVVLGPLLTVLNAEPMPTDDGYLHWTGSAFEWVEPGGGDEMPSTVAWNNITGKPSTFAPSEHTHLKEDITDFAHTHDDRYYTESEIDGFLAAKLAKPSQGTYTKLTVASGGDVTWGTLSASDIPSITKSKISDFPTQWAWSAISGAPFTGDVANSAAKLSDTAAYTAWGRTFFTGGKPASVSGDLDNVANITMSGHISINSFIVEKTNDGLKHNGNIIATGAVSALGISAQGSNSGALSLLSDVYISGTPNDGYVLTYDSTSGKWTPQPTQDTDLQSIPWSRLTGVPLTFTPASHQHTHNDISDWSTAMAGYARIQHANDLMNSSTSNEFTFVSAGYGASYTNGREVYINFHTADGTNGNISQYKFCNGAGSVLATISNGQFSGNAATASKTSVLYDPESPTKELLFVIPPDLDYFNNLPDEEGSLYYSGTSPEDYYAAVLKWLCRKYGTAYSGRQVMFIMRGRPNSLNFTLLTIYDPSRTNSAGLPEYSLGTAFLLGGSQSLLSFGTSNYVYYYNSGRVGYAEWAGNALRLGSFDASMFLCFESRTNYLAARMLSPTNAEKAASTYIEWWQDWVSGSGWFNHKAGQYIGIGLQISGNSHVLGNLGVGTSTPAVKLDVAGQLHTSDDITAIHSGTRDGSAVTASAALRFDSNNNPALTLLPSTDQSATARWQVQGDEEWMYLGSYMSSSMKIGATGNTVLANGASLTIGNCVISWDSVNQMLKFTGVSGQTFNGIYSTGAVSSLGAGALGFAGVIEDAMTFNDTVTLNDAVALNDNLTINAAKKVKFGTGANAVTIEKYQNGIKAAGVTLSDGSVSADEIEASSDITTSENINVGLTIVMDDQDDGTRQGVLSVDQGHLWFQYDGGTKVRIV